MNIESVKHRKFTRIHFNRRVNLNFTENTYGHCQVKNLSIAGMFVMGDFQQQVGEICHVDLVQTGVSTNLTLQASAKVVWTNDEGIAVEFSSMPFDSYMFLQTTLLYEIEDPLSIVHELPDDSPFQISENQQLSKENAFT